MRLLTREGKKNPDIRHTAATLTADLPSKARYQEIVALFDFVRDEIRYVSDITDVETLHTAERILSQGYGDCDDKSILLAAMLESIGHRTRFRALAFNGDWWQGFQFAHVIVETMHGHDKGKPAWIALDTTVDKPMGWTPPCVLHSMEIFNG